MRAGDQPRAPSGVAYDSEGISKAGDKAGDGPKNFFGGDYTGYLPPDQERNRKEPPKLPVGHIRTGIEEVNYSLHL